MTNPSDSSSSDETSDSLLSQGSSSSRAPRPSNSYTSVTKDSQFRSAAAFLNWPIWAKVAVLLAIFAVASIGYLKNHFLTQTEGLGPVAADAELETEDEKSRKPIGDFKLTDKDGKTQNFSDFKGKVVLLSFWASWCEPCLVEMPSFGVLQNSLQDKGLQIVAINVDDGEDGKKFQPKFWDTNKFKFPNFFDADKSLATKFAVDILPSNFIIDRRGRIAFSGFGANDWSSPQTIEMIEGLLAEGTQDEQKAAQ